MSMTINELRGVRSLAVNSKFETNLVRKWRVITESDFVGPLDVLSATGLAIGQPYAVLFTTYPYAWIQSITIDEEGDDGREWIVTANYGPWEPRGEDPTLDPIEVDLEFVEFERPAIKDQDGEAVANSAGDPFVDPPINEDEARAILTVTRNEPELSLSLAATYKNTVNDADFLIGDLNFPKHTLLCKPIKASRRFHAKIGFYFRVTYVFHMALAEGETWKKTALDRGFRKSDGRLILGPDRQPPVEPPLLDGSGSVLPIGDDPVFLEFLTYPEVDFSIFSDLF